MEPEYRAEWHNGTKCNSFTYQYPDIHGHRLAQCERLHPDRERDCHHRDTSYRRHQRHADHLQ